MDNTKQNETAEMVCFQAVNWTIKYEKIMQRLTESFVRAAAFLACAAVFLSRPRRCCSALIRKAEEL